MARGDNLPIAAARLKSFIERIEKMEEEQAAIAADKRDIYSEAKGVGYDVKTMRKVVALRKMDAADRAEQETLLDTYLHALGMVDRVEARLGAGESLRTVAQAEGVSKSTVHRVSQKRADDGNAENGTAKVDVISPPEVAALPAAVETEAKKFMSGDVSVEVSAQPGSLLDRVGAVLEKVAPGKVTRNVVVDTRSFDEIVGEMPAHLRRVPG
jgi:uncharacterized protein (UPF0335 family)